MVTCAFWDEELAIWSTEGVSTLPSTTPGKALVMVCAHYQLTWCAKQNAVINDFAVVLHNCVETLQMGAFAV